MCPTRLEKVRVGGGAPPEVELHFWQPLGADHPHGIHPLLDGDHLNCSGILGLWGGRPRRGLRSVGGRHREASGIGCTSERGGDGLRMDALHKCMLVNTRCPSASGKGRCRRLSAQAASWAGMQSTSPAPMQPSTRGLQAFHLLRLRLHGCSVGDNQPHASAGMPLGSGLRSRAAGGTADRPGPGRCLACRWLPCRRQGRC